MKFNISLISLLFALIPVSIDAQMEYEYSVFRGCVFVKQEVAEVQGDSVVLNMDISIQGIPIGTYEGLVLEPVLYSETDSVVLPPIVLKGDNNYKMYKRERILNKKKKANNQSATILENNPDRILKIAYKDTIPYKDWMTEAGLVLKGTFYNYKGKPGRVYRNVLTEDLKLSK